MLRIGPETAFSSPELARSITETSNEIPTVDKEFLCKALFVRGLEEGVRVRLMEEMDEETSFEQLTRCAIELSL